MVRIYGAHATLRGRFKDETEDLLAKVHQQNYKEGAARALLVPIPGKQELRKDADFSSLGLIPDLEIKQ